jgi:RNA polymerase sigma-70 factor (ECF subfamily)
MRTDSVSPWEGWLSTLGDLHEDPQRFRERLTVLRAQAGDRAAFHELVEAYQQRMTYYVRRLVQDVHQARDILQDVWLDVYRTLDKLQSPAAFRVWLYRIAHNHAVSHIRREKVAAEASDQLAVDGEEIERWNDLDALENAELVHVALNRLSVSHREVMTLRFLEGMDVKEIARVLECSEGTAKSRLHYAKGAMRRLIEEERKNG